MHFFSLHRLSLYAQSTAYGLKADDVIQLYGDTTILLLSDTTSLLLLTVNVTNRLQIIGSISRVADAVYFMGQLNYASTDAVAHSYTVRRGLLIFAAVPQ